MDAMDLTYLILLKGLSPVPDLDKPVIVKYAREIKALNIRNLNYVIVRKYIEHQDFLNIGGTYSYSNTSLICDLMTTSYKDYGLLKEYIRKLFWGQSYVFESVPDNIVDVSSLNFENRSAFIRKFVLSDDILVNEGDYVKFSDEKNGYVFYIDNQGNVYVFMGKGQYMLGIVKRFDDLSDTLKGQYRAGFNIEMKVVRELR